MAKKVDHQFGLFGFQPPKMKVPISAARIEEAKRLMKAGDALGSEAAMREVREGLERYLSRIKTG